MMHPQPKLVLSHYDAGRIEDIRPTLVGMYAEVYAREITEDPFFSVERFEERLCGHATAPSWEAVVGYTNGEPIGYAYGYALRPGAWWSALRTPVEDSLTVETGSRTFGLAEIMITQSWRKTGAAEAIHNELLGHRPEERAALLVERAHPRVRALYERWGYHWFGEILPFPDAPLYDALVKPLRALH